MTGRAATLDSAVSLLRTHQTKARFIAAGVLNTAFGLAIFPLLMWVLQPFGVHYLVVLTISQILAVTFSYTTNKFLVFMTRGNVLREYAKFITFHLTYFLVNLAALPLLVEGARITPIIAQTGFSVCVIVSSYFWHSRITFKTKDRNL